MTLLMRDQENIEKGIEQGIEQGKIYGTVITCRELGLEENVILKKLQVKFHLSEAEAKRYMENAE